jgi:23S rRNA-/tRNA-specific pseudouridylate synthase
MRLKSLFEDDRILAIHKPSGLASHSLGDTDPSCELLLRAQRPELTLFLAHRLDTGTSGVLIFAKTEAAFEGLREQFKLKKIKKEYRAWSEKTPSRETVLKTLSFPYRINLSLAHHAKSKKRMIALPPEKHRHLRGKPIAALSILHSVHEEVFFGISAFRFELEIVTGVMHQIRVHLESLGFPLIGDPVYEKVDREEKPRLGLHARKISFVLGSYHYEISADE